MPSRVVTKIGDVFQTKSGILLQLVAIDYIQLNSDMIAVYKKQHANDLNKLHSAPISFYHHTTVSVGVKQGLWQKIGHAPIPDTSKMIFKQYFDKDIVEILHENYLTRLLKYSPPTYWTTWKVGDKKWKRINNKKGFKLRAETGDIVHPQDIMDRINQDLHINKEN